MSFEEQLSIKKYYEHFIEQHKANNPVEILGELFYEEQSKSDHDLSEIRYAQGELYYHFKDFETAIFKWENVKNELEPWAKKNMADAYVDLGLFAHAEDLYTGIVTESLILNTEISLQLFFLYTKLGKLEKADNMIKWAVSLNPDYPTVTELARNFYEEHKDWKSAVELAVNEGKRKASLHWYSVLKSYIDQGVTRKFPPEYFEEPLLTLKNIRQSHFEQLVSSIWKRFEDTDDYLTWVKSFNHLFNQIEWNEHDKWYETQGLFQEVFFSLINGKYLIKDIEHVIPDLLKNWTKIADNKHIPFAFGAILAWNDYYPATQEPSLIEEAESFISKESFIVNTEDDSIQLVTDILKWGNKESVEIPALPHVEGMSIEGIQAYLNTLPEEERSESLLVMIKKFLTTLLDKKEEQKNLLRQSIQWNEEVLLKLNGAVNQLDDLQFGKNKVIKGTFHTRKIEIKETILSKIPGILKGCSVLVKDDSDFKNLHIEINDEMNLRIQSYLQETVLPLFKIKFQEWVKKAEIEFKESKQFIDEMAEGLNQLFGDEYLQMNCDFQVLNDWKRDMERMTSFVSYEKENILLRSTTSKLLLKSTGKLLGALSQNKGFLVGQYKKLIENEDYAEVAAVVADKFLQQLELFERSLERDIGMFFQNPNQVMHQSQQQIEREKAEREKELQALKAEPEKFYDPIILFQIRHRQFEWLNIGNVGKLVKKDNTSF
jgi:tetratricopeptide (TPR) repeat protein